MAATRRRRPIALAAACATAVTLGATALAATSASAAEVPLKGYELTWGIKQSYRTYVTGMAAGSFTPEGGATQAKDNGAFTFGNGTGTYDSEAHTVSLGFEGGLKIASKLHGFELALSDVKFDSKAAKVTADVTKSGATQQDVPLAEVTVTRDMKDMATKLTKEAADVFGSSSYSGAAGDPLTVVEKKTESPSPSTSTSTTPSGTPSTSASPTPSQTPSTTPSTSPSQSTSATPSPTGADASGDITDGTLGWGVKQSFRTYVVDGVAKGRITVSGGASQAAGNGIFTFVDGTGTYDTDADTLNASFKGSVNFKGHEENGSYGLDLTLSDLKAELDGGSGKLTADVNSLGEKSDDVTLAELKPKSADLTAKNDVITLDDVTTTLTKAGAEAFGGFYQAGAELDPVDLSVALSEDAELPDTDPSSSTGATGGTGTGGTGTTGAAGTTGSTTGGVTGGLASTGSDVPVTALGAAAAATVAAGAGVVFAVRRRRATDSVQS
ncbi:HtaA domain-containing protein [Streptomyces albicerus]|uniref:HtaA domain-containing protein n=1 Tax=Streptomyces albicerus TaxID=2569859 RepID=UPI00124B722D|nr:HtaA domain-containing protein [Streptomyces albicerus]